MEKQLEWNLQNRHNIHVSVCPYINKHVHTFNYTFQIFSSICTYHSTIDEITSYIKFSWQQWDPHQAITISGFALRPPLFGSCFFFHHPNPPFASFSLSANCITVCVVLLLLLNTVNSQGNVSKLNESVHYRCCSLMDLRSTKIMGVISVLFKEVEVFYRYALSRLEKFHYIKELLIWYD